MTDSHNHPNAAELERRYRAERDKRLSGGTTGKYLAPAEALAHYLKDPNQPSPNIREPRTESVDVVIIGAGFGGIQSAVELKKAGIHNFRIIDKAGDVGGVWYWNRYPGISCDIEAYIYMPLLEDMGYMPSNKYVPGAEIFDYAKSIANRFNLYPNLLLRTFVDAVIWNHGASRWTISTRQGDKIHARFVMVSTGVLQSVRLPGIPGIETFKGHSFHTSRWDYEYTGGDSTGGLTKLKDKRVGIIGTGASAVQCIPFLGEYSKELFVFQRTPAAVPVRNNSNTNPEWFKSQQQGWQIKRMQNFNDIVSGRQTAEDLVRDGWTEVLGNIGISLTVHGDDAELRQSADFEYMEKVRARIDEIVADPKTASALKPWYNIMCKRPCFHDSYLHTFNRSNVTLVDTEGRGVQKISERAVWANGKPYEVDCLIFASGFDFQTPDMAKRNGFEIYGRDGHSLTEKWSTEIKTLFGHFNRGFPNLFIQTANQAGLTPNVTHILGETARQFAYMVEYCKEKKILTFEPLASAEDDWLRKLKALSGTRKRYDIECTPSYYNNDGNPQLDAGLNAFYPGGPAEFIDILHEWRTSNQFLGFEVTYE